MSEAIVRATATRWVSDDFPGWVELVVVDAHGAEHRVIEKVPVLTTGPVTSTTGFPVELWVPVVVGEVHGAQVAITFESGVETVDGAARLSVSADDVVWL